jgi:hypothetical protein
VNALRHYSLPRIRQRPKTEPPVRPGRMWLADAVDCVGRHVYGDRWTGDELRARRLPWPPTFLGPRCIGHGLIWSVDTPDGKREFQSQDEARVAWNNCKAAWTTLAKAEWEPRRRYLCVLKLLLGELSVGHIQAYLWDRNTGKEHLVSTDRWARDDAREVFEMGDDRRRWGKPNRDAITLGGGGYGSGAYEVEGQVVVLERDLAAILKRLPSAKNATTLGRTPRPEVGRGPVSDASSAGGQQRMAAGSLPHVQAKTRRAPTAEDNEDFVNFAEELAKQQGCGPSHKQAYEMFAMPRGLSRDGFVRSAIQGLLPPRLRRERGSGRKRNK